jgi:murein peptide amidase A
MVSLIMPTDSRDLRTLLGPLFELAEQSVDVIGSMAGAFSFGRDRYGIARFVFSGPAAAHEPIRLGLFAGIHGDEPAGCQALVRFLEELSAAPELATGYDLVVYPVCNPTGYEDATRTNRAGLDLNREFWRASAQPEVQILERELRAHRFQGIVTLHADDTCDGLYGYAHGRTLNEALLRPALRACERILPRDTRANIDGFAATDSMLRDCFPGVLAAPADQRPKPFDLIFETPARASLADQTDAAVAALHSILAEYRKFIAYAQDL